MKFLSPVYSQASGSIAGLTYSHNKGHNYTRARTSPSNPQSPAQAIVRANLSNCSQAWSALSSENRAGWNAIAPSVAWVNTMGQSIQLSGAQLFNQVNTLRLLAALAIQEAPPESAVRAGLAEIDSVTWSDPDFSIASTASLVNGDRMLAFISRPCSPGRNPLNEPFQLVGVAVVALTIATVAGPDPFNQGNSSSPRAYRTVVVPAAGLPSPSYYEVITASA